MIHNCIRERSTLFTKFGNYVFKTVHETTDGDDDHHDDDRYYLGFQGLCRCCVKSSTSINFFLSTTIIYLLKLVARLTPGKRENVSSENGCTGICGGQVTNWPLTTCSVPTQFIPKPPNVQYIITHNLWVEILSDLFGHLQHQVQI